MVSFNFNLFYLKKKKELNLGPQECNLSKSIKINLRQVLQDSGVLGKILKAKNLESSDTQGYSVQEQSLHRCVHSDHFHGLAGYHQGSLFFFKG